MEVSNFEWRGAAVAEFDRRLFVFGTKLAEQTGTLRHDDLVTKRNALEKRKSRMAMSESSPAKIRSKVWSWMPLAATLALMLASALISTAARAAEVDLKAAASNFSDSCVDCHGQTGKGDGPKAAKLSVKMANLTDCAKMAKVSDDVLFKVVKEGGPAANLNRAMTGFGDAYEDNDIKGLVAYVRSFCGK